MGIEYDEYRVTIKNKKTGDIVKLTHQNAHVQFEDGGPKELAKKKDLEILDFDIVYG